jgi:hypothetical protein
MLPPIGADITRKSLAVDGANVSALQQTLSASGRVYLTAFCWKRLLDMPRSHRSERTAHGHRWRIRLCASPIGPDLRDEEDELTNEQPDQDYGEPNESLRLADLGLREQQIHIDTDQNECQEGGKHVKRQEDSERHPHALRYHSTTRAPEGAEELGDPSSQEHYVVDAGPQGREAQQNLQTAPQLQANPHFRPCLTDLRFTRALALSLCDTMRASVWKRGLGGFSYVLPKVLSQ